MTLILQKIVRGSTTLDAQSSEERCKALQMLIEEARQRQRRRQRWVGTVLAAVVAAAAVVFTVAGANSNWRTPVAHAQAAALVAYPSCTMSSLHPSIIGRPNGAAGTIYYAMKLVDGGTSCTVPPIAIRGYNQVSHAFVGQWSYVESTNTRKVVVTHDHAAYVSFGVRETGNYPPAHCKAANVKSLAVAMSQNRSSIQIVRLAVSICTATRSLLTQSPTLTPTN